MKFGTVIFLLVVLMIALGFLGSDDLHTRQHLQEVYSQIGDLNAQVDGLQQNLSACAAQVGDAQAKLQESQGMIDAREAEIRSLQGRIRELETEAAVLQARKVMADVLGSNPVMLAGLLVYSLAATLLRKKDGRLSALVFGAPRQDRMVRLSERELAALIRSRRSRRS